MKKISIPLSLIRRYRYLKKLDELAFPKKPIPIKIVLRGKGPAVYCNDVQRRGDKPKKEWYEISILARPGNDFNRAVHEVRHRVQWNYPNMPLFTKKRLLVIQKKNPQQIMRILNYLEAVEKQVKKNGKSLSRREEDAIIIEKVIEQKCQNTRDPIKTAAKWIKISSEKIFSPLFFQPANFVGWKRE